MKASVKYDPHYQKSGHASHEAFFGELPKAAVFFFVDSLEHGKVNVQNAGVQSREKDESNRALDCWHAPD